MQRRDLVRLLAGTAAAWPLTRRSAAEAKIPRIGFVESGWEDTTERFSDLFRAGLHALGWTDGANLAIVERSAKGRGELIPGLVAELLGSGVDLMVTVGTPATVAAKTATATVPIVFVGVGDPVAVGLVEDPAKPGGNATGVTLTSYEMITKRLQLLQLLVPGLGCVAVIAREDPGSEQRWEDIRANAEEMGIVVLALEATTGRAIERAFTLLQSQHCQAIYVASGPLGPAKRARIIELAAAARLPAIYPFRRFVFEGGLIALVTDYRDLFRIAGQFVDKILRGARPGDLPVEPPVKFDLIVNLKTAGTLGLRMPPAIIARADEVIR